MIFTVVSSRTIFGYLFWTQKSGYNSEKSLKFTSIKNLKYDLGSNKVLNILWRKLLLYYNCFVVE